MVLAGSPRPAHAGGGRELPAVTAELRAGRPFVLVVAPSAPGRIANSEAYAGWQSYLGDFVQSRPADIAVLRLALADYRRLVAAPAWRDAFGTLFIRGGRRALLHRGLVLEPRIYELGVAFLRTGSSSREAGTFGMVEMAVRRR